MPTASIEQTIVYQQLEPAIQGSAQNGWHDLSGRFAADSKWIFLDATKFQISHFELADTTYELRRELLATFEPPMYGFEGRLSVERLSPLFVGRGLNRDDALNDLKHSLHATIQSLVVKRPFEMDEDERKQWQTLSVAIDLNAYKASLPIKVRGFGEGSGG